MAKLPNIKLGELDLLVIACILILLLAIAIFIILAMLSRNKKIRREVYLERNTAHIDTILFSVAFDRKSINEFKSDPEFIRNWKRRIYREQFLVELIKLHQLYGGEIALNLQRCYKESGLIQLSFEKIRSSKWHLKCAGIQELSEMEVKKAIPIIQELTKSKHQTVKMVALIEVIHLKGLKGLWLLKDYHEPLDNWIQLNLLESIKDANIADVPDFGFLLKAKNESIVVFGLRLLSLFHQSQHLKAVKRLIKSDSRQVSQEAKRTFDKLSVTGDLPSES